MDEFNYFTDDFLSNGGFQQLYTTVEYPEEICLWESRSIDSQPFHQDNVENVDSNHTTRSISSMVECQNNFIDTNASIYSSVNHILTQNGQASPINDQMHTATTVSTAASTENFITDMDQWKLTHSDRMCDGNGGPASHTEWELNLDNLIFDADHSADIASMPRELPEKTFFCNDSCDLFLKESSEHLNTNLQSFRPTQSSSSSSPITTPLTVDPKLRDDEKSFVCTYGECRKVYAKAGHLKAHLRRHIGDKPYVCSWANCTWKFSRSDELSRHRRSHSGIKPYKCDYCPKCFSRSDHLTKHRKVHERKMAAMKVNAVWTSLPQGRPGRRPKILQQQIQATTIS